MQTVRQTYLVWGAFALKPSSLRALWNTVRDGAVSATLTVRFADGTHADMAGIDDLHAPGARHAAMRQVALTGTLPGGAQRRAVFEAGSAFIENETLLAGPPDFIARARQTLRLGLPAPAWRTPDRVAILLVFACVLCLGADFAARAHAGAGAPGTWLAPALVPALLLLRWLSPPSILVAPDDAAFARAAARRQWALAATAALALLLVAAMAWVFRHGR
jgi:hypothetical protein